MPKHCAGGEAKGWDVLKRASRISKQVKSIRQDLADIEVELKAKPLSSESDRLLNLIMLLDGGLDCVNKFLHSHAVAFTAMCDEEYANDMEPGFREKLVAKAEQSYEAFKAVIENEI